MATLQGSGIPRFKLESIPDVDIKQEPMDLDSPASFMDDDDDVYEDAGDLDFSHAQQQIWLSHISRSLWETCSKFEGQDEDEIEIGTIRVEGPESNPKRVSLLLKDLSQLEGYHKEYNLFRPSADKIRSKWPGQALIFSEQDLPGYKPKTFAWDDIDEEGNPGQGRSFLYERHKREQKRKENKGRFQPYTRRPIPKQTSITGVVTREFDAIPVKNEAYFETEAKQTANMLKIPDKKQTVFAIGDTDPSRKHTPFMSLTDRANAARSQQAKRQALKDSRAARVDKSVLIDKLLDLFKLHRIWGLRDLKAKVNQPETYLRSTLDEIAIMHRSGDFNGKWELRDEYKQRDAGLMNPAGMVAPKVEDSDLDKSGMEEDEEDDFEDV